MPPLFGLFVVLMLLTAGSIPLGMLLAIPSRLVARRLGQNPLLFTILALIPLVNLLFFFVLGVLVLLHILDKLDEISAAMAKP